MWLFLFLSQTVWESFIILFVPGGLLASSYCWVCRYNKAVCHFFAFIWMTFEVKLTTVLSQKLSPWVTAPIIFPPQAYWSLASQGSMHTNDRSLGNSLNGKPLKSAQMLFAMHHDKICEFDEALILCLVCHLWVVGAVVSRTQQPFSQRSSAKLPEHSEPSRGWQIVAFYSYFIQIGTSLCYSTASYTDTMMLIYGLFLKLYFGNSFPLEQMAAVRF